MRDKKTHVRQDKTMAAVDFSVSYQLVDGNGAPTAYELLIRVASGLLADAITAANDFAATLDAVTQSQITRIMVTTTPDLPSGLKSSPVADSNNVVGALFDFSNSTFGKNFSRTVANFIPAGFMTTDPAQVDTTNADVQAYINALTETVGGVAQ